MKKLAALFALVVCQILVADSYRHRHRHCKRPGRRRNSRRPRPAAVEQATNLTHEAVSSGDGQYTIPLLPPGTYSIGCAARRRE